MKKVFAAVLALVMALSLTTLAFAAEIDPPAEVDPDKITIEIPVTKTVRLGGTDTPGSAEFHLEVFKSRGNEIAPVSDVEITAIRTNGTQQIGNSISITGTRDQIGNLGDGGFFIREVNGGLDGWTYDTSVWFVEGGAVANSGTEPVWHIWPAKLAANGYEVDRSGDSGDTMRFTNTYTKSSTPRYYYNSTTPTTEPTSSPKTFDAGIALYAALSLTSLTGMAALGRKKF